MAFGRDGEPAAFFLVILAASFDQLVLIWFVCAALLLCVLQLCCLVLLLRSGHVLLKLERELERRLIVIALSLFCVLFF